MAKKRVSQESAGAAKKIRVGQGVSNAPKARLSCRVWPSDLIRAGHTAVTPEDGDALHKFLAGLCADPVFGAKMGRRAKLPCHLTESSKFRHGARRWWCCVHQGRFGTKKELLKEQETSLRQCDQAETLVDFVSEDDIPVFQLTAADKVGDEPHNYCDLCVWFVPPPAMSSDQGARFFPCIRVHAWKQPGGPPVKATYPAVKIRDTTGRFSAVPQDGVTITSPAALEVIYSLESKRISKGGSAQFPRPPVVLTAAIRCKHCTAYHEDVGDRFGKLLHKKHLCGQCGRQIGGKATIGNPLAALSDGGPLETDSPPPPPHCQLHLSSDTTQGQLKWRIWPSTPSLFWTLATREVQGIYVQAFDLKGKCVVDGTYEHVTVDGKKLDRSQLFLDMLASLGWLQTSASVAASELTI